MIDLSDFSIVREPNVTRQVNLSLRACFVEALGWSLSVSPLDYAVILNGMSKNLPSSHRSLITLHDDQNSRAFLDHLDAMDREWTMFPTIADVPTGFEVMGVHEISLEDDLVPYLMLKSICEKSYFVSYDRGGPLGTRAYVAFEDNKDACLFSQTPVLPVVKKLVDAFGDTGSFGWWIVMDILGVMES